MKHSKISVELPSGSEAKIYTYILDNYLEIDLDRKRPMVIIVPGGGYEMVSDREAEAVAIRFLAAGFHAAVLKYSVSPAEFPQALEELAWSVAYMRERAEEWAIDSNKIVIAGFSAGGHLAASLGVFWEKEWLQERVSFDGKKIKPNGLILSYPVISSGEFRHEGSFKNLLGTKDNIEQRKLVSLELQVTANMPPVFIWHTVPDEVVPVQNSMLFTEALLRYGVSVEQHIFPVGGHGLSLATEETSSNKKQSGIVGRCQIWMDLAIAWVKGLEE